METKIKELTDVDKIKEVVLKSKYILTLEDDWDDEGAIKPIAESYDVAIFLFKKICQSYFVSLSPHLFEANVLHFVNTKIDLNAVGDGSIDIHFRFNDCRELLISVSTATITFYCSNFKHAGAQFSIRGNLDVKDSNIFLLSYLYQ